MRRLNNKGISHMLVPLLIVVAVGIVGTYLLVSSHADSVNSAADAKKPISNPADLSIASVTWPDGKDIPEANATKLSSSAASISKNSGTKSYNLTIIGKKDKGACPTVDDLLNNPFKSKKIPSGCKLGNDGYRMIGTSNDTLFVYTQFNGSCISTIPGGVKVKYDINKGFTKLSQITKGAKAKCTFAPGQYYIFSLSHARTFNYWGSAKKKMTAYQQYGTYGKNKKTNLIVLGSDR